MRLKNLDSVFTPSADSSTPSPAPKPVAADMDLGQEVPTTPQTVQPMATSPDQMSQEEFTKKFPTLTATVQITVGQGQVLTCSLVDGKAFLTSATKTKLAGINSSGARPIFLYAGGAWVSDSAKARQLKTCCI